MVLVLDFAPPSTQQIRVGGSRGVSVGYSVRSVSVGLGERKDACMAWVKTGALKRIKEEDC